MISSRRLIQLGFLVLTVIAVFLAGANAERWCPFGGVEALYTYLHEGNLVCSLGVSNFYILGAVLVATLLLRRAFCGYMCPIGAISEWTGKAGVHLGIKPRTVPEGADRVLSLLKYGILGLVLYFTWKLGELVFRGYDPCYALISRHGEDITFWAYGVAGSIVLLSLFFSVPFCRWLCPLAAVLNPFSRFGAARVQRNPGACIDCGKCSRTCTMAIPVDRVEAVEHARCTSCLDCIGACPEQEKGALAWGFSTLPGTTPARSRSVLVAVLLLVFASAVSAAYLFPLPSFVWSRGEAPEKVATLDLEIEGLTCRGTCNLLVYFLERDDDLEVPGFLKLEAWPGPGAAAARLFFDPARTGADNLKAAISEPYYDYDAEIWRNSPFRIEGYAPF